MDFGEREERWEALLVWEGASGEQVGVTQELLQA